MSRIELETDRAAYRSGEPIRVALRWTLDERPQSLLVNLLWYTQGKGDEDVTIVSGEAIENPGTSGSREIAFTAPAHPPSFSGKLISLSWAIEALTEPADAVERCEIVIAPEAAEILLGDAADDNKA